MKPSETAELEAIAESKEHLKQAEIAQAVASPKSSYDTYEYSDNYYKSEKNDENQEFERIRKEGQELSNTESLISQTTQGDEIEKYFSRLEFIEKAIANYSRKYSNGTLDSQTLQIIGELQHGVSTAEDQIFQLVGFNIEKYRENFDIFVEKEPYKTISEFQYTTREDMINRFGKDFLIYQTFRRMAYSCPREIKEEVLMEIERQKQQELQQDFQEKEDELKVAVQEASTMLSVPFSSFNPVIGLSYLEKSNLSYYFDSHPNFQRFKTIYDGSKAHIENEIIAYYEADPTKLSSLTEEQLTKALEIVTKRQKSNILQGYIESTEEDKILAFLEKNLNSYNPINLANTMFPYLGNENLSPKMEKIGQFYISQLPKMLPQSLETNAIVFKTTAHFLHRQQKSNDPSYLQTITQIADSIPEHIQFIQRHPQQMNSLLSFISWTFLEIPQPGELTDENIQKLERKFKVLDTGDRYHNVQERFDNLIQRLKNRPKPRG